MFEELIVDFLRLIRGMNGITDVHIIVVPIVASYWKLVAVAENGFKFFTINC